MMQNRFRSGCCPLIGGCVGCLVAAMSWRLVAFWLTGPDHTWTNPKSSKKADGADAGA